MTAPTHACAPKTPAWQPNNTKNTHVISGYDRGGPGLVLAHQGVPGPNRYNGRKQRL